MNTPLTTEQLVCPCCDLPQKELRESAFVSMPVCQTCMFEWYEGAGESDPSRRSELIRAASRKAQGAAS